MTTPTSESNPTALLYAAVNERRAELGWTWRDVENATGLTYETYRSMNAAGKPRRPHARTLRAIDQGLGWRPGSAAAAMAGGRPGVDPTWRLLPGPPGARGRVAAFVAAQLAEAGELPSLERVIIGLGVPWVDQAEYAAACTQAQRDADPVRAALRALALESADLVLALARYDSGDCWIREIAAALRKAVDHDIDDGVRQMLVTAASRGVARVLATQRTEVNDLNCLISDAGIH